MRLTKRILNGIVAAAATIEASAAKDIVSAETLVAIQDAGKWAAEDLAVRALKKSKAENTPSDDVEEPATTPAEVVVAETKKEETVTA